MANNVKDVLITPATGHDNEPSIKFVGYSGNTVTLMSQNDGSLAFMNNTGRNSFVVENSEDPEDEIFSVRDLSGFPLMQIKNDGTIKGFGAGEVVAQGDMYDLGYVGSQSGDIDIPLPKGYKYFRVQISVKSAWDGSTRTMLWYQVKDSAGTRLSMECNSWTLDRGTTAGNENGFAEHTYSDAATWAMINDYIDGSHHNYFEFGVEGLKCSRPSIIYDGNGTVGAVGSSRFLGSSHVTMTTQIRSIGLNSDAMNIEDFQYRVIGYK